MILTCRAVPDCSKKQVSFCGKLFTVEIACPKCRKVNVYEDSQQPIRIRRLKWCLPTLHGREQSGLRSRQSANGRTQVNNSAPRILAFWLCRWHRPW